MILIAEGGATKCDWALITAEDTVLEFPSIGVNPLFHSEDSIVNELQQLKEIKHHADKIEEVYFYGAGGATEALKMKLEIILRKVFAKAGIIQIHTDLMAAAVATYGGQPCISCILGTGSNACFFDGNALKESNPALGYILGDEGSGAYFGKELIADFLYKQMPQHLWTAFRDSFGLDKQQIIDNVYRKPNANVYLASFMPFYFQHRKETYIQKKLNKGFSKFLLIHVMCFKNYSNKPVHFVGSVDYFFKEELTRQLNKLNIKTGRIIQKPIEGLILHHRANN